MRVSRAGLIALLDKNVLELKFTRRVPSRGHNVTRRMLCTNNKLLLNSVPGRVALNFRPTNRLPKHNPAEHNLVIVWDIFVQDYRQVSVESCEVVSVMPADDKFWEYFNEKLTKMSVTEKVQFMDS